jgi:methyl-accepting chemotaxis protein
VNQATAEQAQSMQDVVGMLDDIAAVSDQTAAKADSVAGAAESQTATLSTVAENTSELADAAADLETRLDDFEAAESETGERAVDTEFEFGATADGPDASVDLGADTGATRSDLATDGGDE